MLKISKFPDIYSLPQFKRDQFVSVICHFVALSLKVGNDFISEEKYSPPNPALV